MIDFKQQHLLNVQSLISITVSGITTEVKLVHLQIEWLLILMTVFAMTTDTKPYQSQNVPETMIVRNFWSIIDIKFLQSSNT